MGRVLEERASLWGNVKPKQRITHCELYGPELPETEAQRLLCHHRLPFPHQPEFSCLKQTFTGVRTPSLAPPPTAAKRLNRVVH